MTTVQVAIRDTEYAQTICSLLRREGRYSILVVDEPDLKLEGVVVLDCEHLEALALSGEAPERFVLVTRKDPEKLARLWNAGIRHVVFQEDSPSTAQLAVSAAELRQPRSGGGRTPERTPGEERRPVLHRHHQRSMPGCAPGSCASERCGCHGHLCFPEMTP